MVSKAEVQTNTADTIKLVAAGALVLLGLVAFYYFEGQSLLLRVVGLLVIAGLACIYRLSDGSWQANCRFFSRRQDRSSQGGLAKQS